MFERILVPLDGSRLAESVLPVVERLAPLFGSQVVLLHVLERGAPSTVHGERHFTNVEDAGRYLEGLAATLRGRGLSVAHHAHDVPVGDVAAGIAEHGPEERADLVVLCTHGDGGVRDFLFGSIAQQVLQRGTTPVLLVRPAAPDQAPEAFDPRTILVPLDATLDAEAALGPAEELARKLGARLHLTMVVATAGTIRGSAAAAATMLPAATRKMLDLQEQQGADYLEEIAAGLRARGLTVETEVNRGETAARLADETAAHEVGLVVVATHGRAGLQAIWGGSVVSRFLARTRGPVLLLRTIDRERPAP